MLRSIPRLVELQLQSGVLFPELGHRTLVLRLAHGKFFLLLVQTLPQFTHLLLVLPRLADPSLVQQPLRILQFLVSYVPAVLRVGT